jgi:phage terminase small subunit
MTVLANHRRELFAQLLFQGFTAVDAYKKAGYKRHDGNACTLAKHPEILARLEEIRGEGQGEQGWPVGTRAIAARAKVTVESLIDDSEKVLQRAMEINQLGAANTAIKGKGILSGKWIERQEVGGPGEYDSLSDDDLEQQIMERIARLGFASVVALADFSPSETDAPSETE